MTTILIVDDERVIRDGLVRSIKSAGFDTRAAEGVIQARAELPAAASTACSSTFA